jgi:hypothetical protein
MPYLEAERILLSIALEAGLPYRTVQRWVGRHRKSHLATLPRPPRSDQGDAFTLSYSDPYLSGRPQWLT